MNIGNVNIVYNKGKESHPVVIYEEIYANLPEYHLGESTGNRQPIR